MLLELLLNGSTLNILFVSKCNFIFVFTTDSQYLDAVIISNGIAMLIRILQSSNNLEEGARIFSAAWDSCLFLSRECLKYYETKLRELLF